MTERDGLGARGAADRKPARPEKRASGRVSLLPGAAVLEAGGRAVPVLDLSADGARLLVPPEGIGSLGSTGRLRFADRSTLAARFEIVRQALRDVEGLALGIRLEDLSREDARLLADFLRPEFIRRQRGLGRVWDSPGPLLRIRDPARILSLLRLRGLHEGRALGVYDGIQPLPARLRLISITRDARLEFVVDEPSALPERSSLSFLLPGPGAVALFSAVVLARRDRRVTTSFPEELIQAGFRESRRIAAGEGDGAAVLVLDRRLGGRPRPRSIEDLSDRGLSFPVSEQIDAFLPGDLLDEARVELPSGPVVGTAVVRRVAPGDGDGLFCGIEFRDFLSREDRLRWESYVLAKACPRTSAEGPLARTAWDMLDSSGYLDLWTREEDRARLERRFLDQWSWPRALPGHLIVLREGARAAGTFATSRLYPSTWLLHSLGVDKDARRRHGAVLDLARELYAALLRLLAREIDGRFFALFVQKDKRWTDLLYGGFVRSLPPGAPSVYDEYALYKCRTAGDPAPLPAGARRFQVSDATEAELPWIAERLAERLPALEVEAYAYGPGEIDLRSFSPADPAGLVRRLLVARDESGIAGVAVQESGSEGVNVFGLLNSCRLFVLRPGPALAGPALAGRGPLCSALLAATRESYRSRGVQEFIVFATDEEMRATAGRDGCLVSEGVRWVAARELLPAWAAYVDEVLEARTQEVRGEPSGEADPDRTRTEGSHDGH
ncbi:MAG: PilZ domain-containing protein [Vicinamibacteria bacterium]